MLESRLKPKGIWLRTEKGMRESERLELADGLARGVEPPRPLFIVENGLRFGVDVTQGHKTGFYLDQRENRLAAARYVAGHRVLDLFCYTGGVRHRRSQARPGTSGPCRRRRPSRRSRWRARMRRLNDVADATAV